MLNRTLLFCIVLMSLFVSCTDEPEETTPDPFTTTGQWYGYIGDDIVTVDLVQSSSNRINGSVFWESIGLSNQLNAGTKYSDNTVTLEVKSRDCRYHLSGSFVTRNRLQGRYYYVCDFQGPVEKYWSLQKVTVLQR